MTYISMMMDSPLGHEIARSLLHFLWQGTLLGIAAAIVLRMLVRSASHVRYGVACLFLLAMALMPAFTFAYLTSQSSAAAPGTVITLPPPAQGPGDIGTGDLSGESWLSMVLALWVAGVVACSVRAAGGWGLALYRLSAGRTDADIAVRNAVGTIAHRLGINQSVRVFQSSMAAVPAVFGAIRPVIILPISAVSGLPPAQLEAILAHELAHIARHDFLVNCLQTLVEVVLFYHPAVWLLSRRIRQERELCCDTIAGDVCGDRILYSRALLALEERRQEFALAATGGDLKARIEHLLFPTQAQRRRPTPGMVVPVLLILPVLLIALGTFVARAQEKPPATPYDKWLREDVVYIIQPEERVRFESLTTDEERQRFIEQFWERRDPTVGTPENEAKEEHYRRIMYSNERFAGSVPGWQTDRGRCYIVNGPPREIEAHPRDLRESWRYGDSRQFDFQGPDYALASETGVRATRVLAWINVERVPEPRRGDFRRRLSRFIDQPFTNDLMEQIRAELKGQDFDLIYTWGLDKITGNGTLVVRLN